MDERKEPLRQLLLAAHPEWRGCIRIYRHCVGVRGLGRVWWRDDNLSLEAEAKHFIEMFEDLIEHRGA